MVLHYRHEDGRQIEIAGDASKAEVWLIYPERELLEKVGSMDEGKEKLPEGFEQVGEFEATGTRLPATDGSDALWFIDEVTFTAKVRRKPGAKGRLNATVSFQACDDQICLPPNKLSVAIDL